MLVILLQINCLQQQKVKKLASDQKDYMEKK